VPQGADADRQAQVCPEFFEGAVGLLGNGGPQFGLVSDVERLPLGGVAAGRHLARLVKALEERSNPLGGHSVLAGNGGEGHSALAIRQHPTTQIQRERGHGSTPATNDRRSLTKPLL
jgi:hypothetical protein